MMKLLLSARKTPLFAVIGEVKYIPQSKHTLMHCATYYLQNIYWIQKYAPLNECPPAAYTGKVQDDCSQTEPSEQSSKTS